VSDGEQKVLLLVGEGVVVDVRPLPAGGLSGLAERGITSGPAVQALAAGIEDQVLFVTTDYRFLLVTPRQLSDLQALDLTLADLFRLKPREMLCAAGRWEAIRNQERLLLVTSTGFVRAYPLDALRENIEGPVPLMFDTPPAGVPVAIFGVSRDEEVALLTEGGRGLRWPLQKLPLIGLQAINLGREDRLNQALAGEAGTEMVLLTADGYGRRMRLGDLEIAPRANAPGKVLIARRSPAVALAALPESERLWVVTSQGWAVVDVSGLHISQSTATDRLLHLDAEERLETAVQW
jgi:DNA gyrase/topoisomerase IV subunit A